MHCAGARLMRKNIGFRIGGSEMIVVLRRAAVFAALICMSAIPAFAQQQPGPAAQSSDSYKPPARFMAQEATPKTQKPAAAPTAATATKTIGLISLIGDTFYVKRVGFTAFGNELEKSPVLSWKIDDRVATTVGRILQKKFKIKRIQVPAAAFQTLHEGQFIFNGREEAQAKFLGQYTAGQNCDYYLLVSPGGSPLSNTNQGLYGLGVVRWDHILFPGEFVHALSVLTVYDPKMEKIRWESGTIGQETFMATIKGPHQELKEGNKLPADAKATVADPRTQKIAWELLEKSLTMTVPKLFAAN
jgi:hypothetical protein